MINLTDIARSLVAPGKGILAADESSPTIEKRFKSDMETTKNLNAMNQIGGTPWELSFSFGRALQAPALKAWAGKAENVATAQHVLLHRARCNQEARFGRYREAMEQAVGTPGPAPNQPVL